MKRDTNGKRIHRPNRHICETARRIKLKIAAANDGRLPRSVKAWERLCETLDVPVSPLWHCPEGFTARCFQEDRLRQGWLIVYNPHHSARQIMRFLCHEVSEWLAIIDYPCLFDGMPDRVYAYTGGSDPDDARHRIARRVEKLCFRKP